MKDYQVTFKTSEEKVFDHKHLFLLAETPVSSLKPIRKPNNYAGQKHIAGLYYSPNTGLHHPYESRLESQVLLCAEFEFRPEAIATQPFALHYNDGCKQRTHVPDILIAQCGRSPIVIDVKPRNLIIKNSIPFSALENACSEIGWSYTIWPEPDPSYFYNLSFLLAYHRPVKRFEQLADIIRYRLKGESLSLATVLADLDSPHAARYVLYHLLWQRIIHTDLSYPLNEDSLIRSGVA